MIYAVEIISSDAGNAGMKTLDIVHTSTQGALEEEDCILINTDKSGTTGGDLIGINFLTTEGSATSIALNVGAESYVIEQLSGTFNATSTGTIDVRQNTTTTNLTISTLGTNTEPIFPADDDYIIVADTGTYEEIEILMDTVASNPGIGPTFEYWTGSWTTFMPTDGCNGMRNSGVIQWLAADVPGWITDSSLYKIKITRTRNNLGTNPIISDSGIKVAAVTEYHWNHDGEILCNDVTTTSLVTDSMSIESKNPDLIIKDTSAASGGTNHIITFQDNVSATTGSLSVINTLVTLTNSQTNGDIVMGCNGSGVVKPSTTAITDLGESGKTFNSIWFNPPSGATQVGSGAGVGEIWKTASHATLPDNVLLIGV